MKTNSWRTELLQKLRGQLRMTRTQILARFPQERAWLEMWASGPQRLGWVLGGPRCGTSAFKAALAQHGQVLSLPGEHRCYFTLLERNYPDHGRDTEADDETPLSTDDRSELLEMILLSAFAGPVAARPDEEEIARYAWEWALRLPMQWPQLELDAGRIVDHVQQAMYRFLKTGGTANTPEFDVFILQALQELDAQIDPRMYDLPAELIASHFDGARISDVSPVPVIVEITPYVVLQPRRLKTPNAPGDTLLLKASSDPFRLRTMTALFEGWDVRLLHLTRNPLASINGLIDGWAHLGFWQHDLSHVLGKPMQRQHWKFDLVDGWRELASADLVRLAAEQWRIPNQRLLDHLSTVAVAGRFAFEDFLRHEDRATLLTCAFAALGLEPDELAQSAIRTPPMINATRKPAPARWRSRADLLRGALSDQQLSDTARRLGYDPLSWDDWI